MPSSVLSIVAATVITLRGNALAATGKTFFRHVTFKSQQYSNVSDFDHSQRRI